MSTPPRLTPSHASSSSPAIERGGEKRDNGLGVGPESESGVLRECRKKRTRKVYSAEALSRRTRTIERYSDSGDALSVRSSA